jgi:hypothetical protein
MISEEDMENIQHYKPVKEEEENGNLNSLYDYTKLFLEKLKFLNGKPSAILMQIGGQGSGKTASAFILLCLIMKSDLPNPCIVFWKAPPNFLDKIKNKCPNSWLDRLYSVKNLRDINNLLGLYSHVIFIMDEATRDMNGKQATTLSSRKFEKAVTLFRQKNVFFIYNTQIGNVTKSLRGMTSIRIYKANTKPQINESDDSFAKDHTNQIVNLYNPWRKKFCLFESSWSEFLDENPIPENRQLITEGYFNLNLDLYCPWFDEELSRGYSDADLDCEFGDEKDKNQLIFEIAEKFMKEKPGTPLKMITQPYIEGWLRVTDEDLLYDVQQLIPKIYSVIRYKLGDKKILEIEELEKKQLEKEKKKTKRKDSSDNDDEIDEDDDELVEEPDDTHASIVGFEIEKGSSFAKFASEKMSYKILEELFQFEKATKITVDIVRSVLFHLITEGSVLTQEQLANICGLSKGLLNDVLKKFRDLNFRREIGYLLEDWWVANHGGSSAHNEHIPDWIDPNTGEIWSFKWRLDYSKQLKFYQNSDFRPEYEAARKANKNYKVGFLNSAWNIDMQVVEVNPFADPDVIFRKE